MLACSLPLRVAVAAAVKVAAVGRRRPLTPVSLLPTANTSTVINTNTDTLGAAAAVGMGAAGITELRQNLASPGTW